LAQRRQRQRTAHVASIVFSAGHVVAIAA
jgi:hypothetical protein